MFKINKQNICKNNLNIIIYNSTKTKDEEQNKRKW